MPRLLPFAILCTTLLALACSRTANPDLGPTIAAEQTIVIELSRDPTPVPPLGTTCQADFPPVSSRMTHPASGGDVAFRRDNPFCIAWTDVFSDETGFRVVVSYGPSDRLEYLVPANVNEFYPPPGDAPDELPPLAADPDAPENAGRLAAYKRKDIAITVFALTPAGEVVVDGFALTIQ